MKKRGKTVLIILSAVLLLGGLEGGLYLKSISDYKAKVNALDFANIDLSKVADGVYDGSCETGVVNATVQVTVRDHVITDISLVRHDNGRGASAEAVLQQMLRSQTTDVDAVSGATCSSKVIRKAVENALTKGLS